MVPQVGLGICYDLRFPELSAALQRDGAQILTYPSAFTVATGAAHWEVWFTGCLDFKRQIIKAKLWAQRNKYLMHLFPGVTSSKSNRDPVLRPGGGAGRSAPWETHVVRSLPGGGPLGRSARRLWRGEPRPVAGGNRPGEGQQHQEKHASPAAPERHRFLSQSGEDLMSKAG